MQVCVRRSAGVRAGRHAIAPVDWTPTPTDSPSTSSRLESIEPSRLLATTSYSPARSAARLSMTSTTLPNVALSRPPTVHAGVKVIGRRREGGDHGGL